jgi:pseudaminic acid cytidylyltransferase
MAHLAIITARGGSKRIPRKNIKDFCGKPILAYSIEAALASGLFDEVMVSTDDAEIAQLAQQYGAVVPFWRSQGTSDDFATTAEVLYEVLQQYQQQGRYFQTACCLYPTAPFVSPELLRTAQQRLFAESLDCVFPIQRFGFPIQRALRQAQGYLDWMQPEFAQSRSQDLEAAFHDAGQWYFFLVAKFMQNRRLLTDRTAGIEISELDAHDIDTPEDWQIAEFKFRLKQK